MYTWRADDLEKFEFGGQLNDPSSNIPRLCRRAHSQRLISRPSFIRTSVLAVVSKRELDGISNVGGWMSEMVEVLRVKLGSLNYKTIINYLSACPYDWTVYSTCTSCASRALLKCPIKRGLGGDMRKNCGYIPQVWKKVDLWSIRILFWRQNYI